MQEQDRYAPPKARLDPAPAPSPILNGPSGLGGWLVLVGIGLVVAPVRIAINLVSTYLPLFRGETWDRITTPGSPAYHPLWAPLITYEVAGNLALAALSVWSLVLFLRKSRLLPRFVITLNAASLLFVGGDHIAAEFIPAIAGQSDPESMRELVRSIVAAVVWIPYFLVSKRVKNTFVH